MDVSNKGQISPMFKPTCQDFLQEIVEVSTVFLNRETITSVYTHRRTQLSRPVLANQKATTNKKPTPLAVEVTAN